jgi:hypothetical protein
VDHPFVALSPRVLALEVTHDGVDETDRDGGDLPSNNLLLPLECRRRGGTDGSLGGSREDSALYPWLVTLLMTDV